MMRKKTVFVVFTAVGGGGGGETQKDNKTALFWFWEGNLNRASPRDRKERGWEGASCAPF